MNIKLFPKNSLTCINGNICQHFLVFNNLLPFFWQFNVLITYFILRIVLLSSLEIKKKFLNFMIIKRGLSNYCFCFAGVLLVTSISLYFFVFSAPSPCLPIKCSFILWKGNSKGEKFVLFEPILEGSNGRSLPSTLMAEIFFWCRTNVPKPLKIHRHWVRMVFYIFEYFAKKSRFSAFKLFLSR